MADGVHTILSIAIRIKATANVITSKRESVIALRDRVDAIAELLQQLAPDQLNSLMQVLLQRIKSCLLEGQEFLDEFSDINKALTQCLAELQSAAINNGRSNSVTTDVQQSTPVVLPPSNLLADVPANIKVMIEGRDFRRFSITDESVVESRIHLFYEPSANPSTKSLGTFYWSPAGTRVITNKDSLRVVDITDVCIGNKSVPSTKSTVGNFCTAPSDRCFSISSRKFDVSLQLCADTTDVRNAFLSGLKEIYSSTSTLIIFIMSSRSKRKGTLGVNSLHKRKKELPIVTAVRELTLQVDELLYGFIMECPATLVKAFDALTAQLQKLTPVDAIQSDTDSDSDNTPGVIDTSDLADIIDISTHCVDVGRGTTATDDQTYSAIIEELYQALYDLTERQTSNDIHSVPIIDTTQITTIAAVKSALCQLVIFFAGRYYNEDDLNAIAAIGEFKRLWNDVCHLWKDQQLTYKEEDYAACAPSLEITLDHIADMFDVEDNTVACDTDSNIYSIIEEIERLGDDSKAMSHRRVRQIKRRKMIKDIFVLSKLRLNDSLYYKRSDMQRAIDEITTELGKSSDDEWNQFYKKVTSLNNEIADYSQLVTLIRRANDRIDNE